jgi:uncharacterized protein (TIGR02996 family)
MDKREAFLADICEHPADDTPRLIFADWLDDHGDPDRAAFIRLQCQFAGLATSDPRRPALLARQRELWREMADTLRAELPQEPGLDWFPLERHLLFERGFAGKVLADSLTALRAAGAVFRTIAPVREVHLDSLSAAEAATLGGPDDPPGLERLALNCEIDEDLIRALAGSPLARRLVGLDLSALRMGPASLVNLTVEPAFANLRRLHLPNLYRLPNHGIAAALADSPVLTNLTDLLLDTARLDDEDARRLALSPRLLGLERLELWSNRIGPAGVRAFVEGPERPALTHFTLGSNRVGDEGAVALAAWPALRQFRCFELANNNVSAAYIEGLAHEGVLADVDQIRLIICTNRDHTLRTGVLCVYNNRLTEKGVSALLRSPYRGRLDELELWSSSLVTEKSHERLRLFFAGDSRVS